MLQSAFVFDDLLVHPLRDFAMPNGLPQASVVAVFQEGLVREAGSKLKKIIEQRFLIINHNPLLEQAALG